MSSSNCVVRGNTFDYCGSAATLWVGTTSTVEENLFLNHGLVQTDSCAAQLSRGAQPGGVVRDNWAWWGQSLGYRFDTPHTTDQMGYDGTMIGNVAFGNKNGFSVKGDRQTITVRQFYHKHL